MIVFEKSWIGVIIKEYIENLSQRFNDLKKLYGK